MEKYFITSAVPNGFRIENNKHRLCISICLDVDIANLLQKDKETDLAYRTRLGVFLDEFNLLGEAKSFFTKNSLSLKLDHADFKGTIDTENELKDYCDPQDMAEIRKKLWSNIFDNDKGKRVVADTSKVTQGIGIKQDAIESLTDYLPNLNGLLQQPGRKDYSLRNHYSDSNTFSVAKNEIAANENLAAGVLAYKALPADDVSTIKSQFRTLNKKNITDFLNFRENVFEKFLELNIDPEEFINTFSSINKNIILKRLMGFVIDVSIELPEKLVPIDDGQVIGFQVQASFKSQLCSYLVVPFQSYCKNKKFAYFLESSSSYFNHTLLNDQQSQLLLFDKIAQEEKLQQQKERRDRGEVVTEEEVADSFTRGILYGHPKLKEIIKVVSYARDTNNNIVENGGYDEDFHVAGQRVALHNRSAISKVPFLSSITNRSFVIRDKNGKNMANCESIEGCITFDALGTKVETDGEVKHTTSDVLFEWSGQQLTLKSAFSRASTISKLNDLHDKVTNQHDDGLWKSELKTRKHLLVDVFPFKEQDPNEEKPGISLLYGLPKKPGRKLPRLLYGQTYSFVVYHEYKNGWGLPLEPTNEFQLAVTDLLDASTNFSKEIMFRALENIKPLKFIHTKKVNEQENNVPLSEKESLDHLIVRSDSAADTVQLINIRHLVLERSSLENIFWQDRIFSDHMSGGESFRWKTKYNCPFHSKNDYLNKKKTCPEKCSSYCEGTHLEAYYGGGPIQPNYLTDPSVKAFTIKLFWDKAHTLPVDEKKGIQFSGPEIRRNSYLLKANGAVAETHLSLSVPSSTLEVRLKKGAQLHAQLFVEVTNEANKALELGWWKDINLPVSKLAVVNEKVFHQNRIIPKNFILTHAVKQPLLSPVIFKLFSTPIKATVGHVVKWLRELSYPKYEIGLNVIAERTTTSPNMLPIGSTFGKVNLVSRFERLDSISKLKFLKDILPTGSLEIWMRKEDYIDDPDHFVLNNESVAENTPDYPVVSFRSADNQFTLEHKIEFSNEIIAQLKDLNNISYDDKINDAFQAVMTTLSLHYDLRSYKFEEREYYLKNISKYMGYFTNEKFATDPKASEKLEPYVLPKLTSVLSNETLRFKAILLNNKRPKSPELAYAGTTIQETRSYPYKHTTIAEQQGNIITCYLKRGRLSSGKNERVGVIVNDANASYNDFFKENNWISKAGRDILSDRYANASAYLQKENISTIGSKYNAGYDQELGLVHYLPKFDAEKQLWKFEIELNVTTKDDKQLHNPFINLALVHFQPYSINYNTAVEPIDWGKDCRISNVDVATWGYLLPKRSLSVYFNRPNLFHSHGTVNATLNFDFHSLNQLNHAKDADGKEWMMRTNFILTLEGCLSHDSMIWEPINSRNTEVEGSREMLHHPLLDPAIVNESTSTVDIKLAFDRKSTSAYSDQVLRYREFRVRLIEIEWFSYEAWNQVLVRYKDMLAKGDVLNREDFKIRYIELIY